MRPKTNGILETALYVDDPERSANWYQDIFGFTKIADFGARGCAMQAGQPQVLLLFKKGASLNHTAPHDGEGQLHVAFAVSAAELQRWEEWLSEKGIPIEDPTTWPLGGKSLYFRDPDGHLLEVVSPGVWSVY
jgi:catechol 2,3-dioxygenase-like lactoylglutathione lyase family enzyme